MAVRKLPSADIKSRSRRYLLYSLTLSLLMIISAFRFFPVLETEMLVMESVQEVITIEDIVNTRQENKPPPPLRPPIPVEGMTDETLPDIDLDTEFDADDDVTPPIKPPTDEDQDVADEDEYFEVVEDPPTIDGDLGAIREHLEYPPLAIRAGIEGTVALLVYVSRTGEITKVEVLKGIGGGCDEAAIEAVKQVTINPGMQRGKPVNVKMAIPVRFRLN